MNLASLRGSRGQLGVAVAVVAVLMVGGALRVGAHMTGCLPVGYCCAEDNPNGCPDDGAILKVENFCVECYTMSGGLGGCNYKAWFWDYNGDKITDCTETCFQGWNAGGCP